MMVSLKKNSTIDDIKYLKHEEFYIKGVNWDEGGNERYYITSKKGDEHTADSSLFDILKI